MIDIGIVTLQIQKVNIEKVILNNAFYKSFKAKLNNLILRYLGYQLIIIGWIFLRQARKYIAKFSEYKTFHIIYVYDRYLFETVAMQSISGIYIFLKMGYQKKSFIGTLRPNPLQIKMV